MRILLILVALLPFLAAVGADPQELRREFLRMAEESERYAVEVERDAAELSLSNQVPALLRRMRDELTAEAGTIQEPRAESESAKAVWKRMGEMHSGAIFLTSQSRLVVAHAKSFIRKPNGSEPHRQYLDQMSAMVGVLMNRLAVDGTLTSMPMTPVERARWEALAFAIRLVHQELLISEGRALVPATEPPASECLVWCRAARSRIDAELARPLASDDEEQKRQLEDQSNARSMSEQRLNHWAKLVDVAGRRRATMLPPFSDTDGPGLPALRAILDRQAEHLRQVLAILADKDAMSSEDWDQIVKRQMDEDQMNEAERAATDAIDWQREFASKRKELMGQVAKCSEKVRRDFQARFDQIATDSLRFQSRQLKAFADLDRVDAAEAAGDLELVQLRLAALEPEAEIEAELAESEAVWRGQEKEPGVREAAKRFQDLRGKLGDAFAKELKIRLAQQQIRNRIAMLELKDEFTVDLVSDVEETVRRLRDEIGDTRKDLEEAAARASDRAKQAKDAKDAERIPLVKPGVDDF